MLQYLESLYAINADETEMLTKMREYFSPINDWSRQFLGSPYGHEMDFKIEGSKDEAPTTVHIDKIIDIEENIWSPLLGLKGIGCQYCFVLSVY